MSVMPTIDERVHAIGTSRLRSATAEWLRELNDHAYIIQGPDDENLAVLVSYKTFLAMQKVGDERQSG